jgi:hypothetical protein
MEVALSATACGHAAGISVQIKTPHLPQHHHRPCAFAHVSDLSLADQATVLQAVGLVAHLDDVAVVCQPIQQRVPILASPNLLDHSEKLRLVLMTTVSQDSTAAGRDNLSQLARPPIPSNHNVYEIPTCTVLGPPG